MGVKENKKIVERWHDELWNKGNVDAVDELIDTNCIYHIDPQPTDIREYWRQAIATFRAAFSDAHITNEDMVAEGDKVATRWTWRMKHTGEWMGIAATGTQVEVKGISIHRVVGGKIVEDWAVGDQLSMMRQIGVIPSLGE